MNKTDKELAAEIVSAYLKSCHTNEINPMPLTKESLKTLIDDVFQTLTNLDQ